MSLFKTGLLVAGLCVTYSVSAEWYVEVGPWHRGDMNIEVTGGSRAAESGARIDRPGVRGDAPSSDLPGMKDDGTAQILREFDNGFVGPSGLPFFFNLGQTQFFGFQDDTQHGAGAGTLSFSRTESVTHQAQQTRTTLQSSAGTWSDHANLNGYGLQARAGYVFLQNNRWDFSGQAQLGWLGGLSRNVTPHNAFRQELRQTTRESRVSRTETTQFVYDTFNNPAFPLGPYEMSDPNGIGPLISDRPIAIQAGAANETRTDRIVGRRNVVANSQVHLETDADLFVLGLGPRIRFNMRDDISLFIQGGGTLNLLDVRLQRQESFITDRGRLLGQWNDRSDEQKWLWGASLSVGGQWELTERLTLSAAGGYDWVERSRLSIGPDQVRYDLSGYQVEVAFGWRFGVK